jgi:hypothetical protein
LPREQRRFLGLSGHPLEKLRHGAEYRKIGGRVVYALDDLRPGRRFYAESAAASRQADQGLALRL